MLTASLAAHLALFAVWMTVRPDRPPAESAAIQVELLRPPPREPPRQRPPPPPRPRAAAEPPISETLPVPAPVAPPILSSPPAPGAPNAIDPRKLTDQQILQQAGPRPDINKLHETLGKRPLYSSTLRPGGDDCKPASEHSNRIAPPCPAWGAGPMPKPPPERLPDRPDVSSEARYKDAMKRYKEAPGAAGYPGFGCAIFHKC